MSVHERIADLGQLWTRECDHPASLPSGRFSDLPNFQKPIQIEQALELIAARVKPLREESVPLDDAVGRFVARQVNAPIDLPRFDNSAMDGYAVRASDTPGRLTIVGESAAGAPFTGRVEQGQAVAISTGAVLPVGTDAVAQVEDVVVDADQLTVRDAVGHGTSIRYAAGDIRRGDRLLPVGMRIGPAQIGALAAVGLDTVMCRRRPRVAVLATGTELRPAGAELQPGEIFNSNAPMLRACLDGAGALAQQLSAAQDTREAHTAALRLALEHDVVISSGGVSVGPHDLVREAARALGVEEVFWRVAIRPGKPVTFGVRGDTLMFGLPGNPVSTLVCFELFVKPALLTLQGAADATPELRRGTLATAVRRNPERDDFIRAQLDTADGLAVLQPLRDQQSHQIAITAQGDALARIPAGDGELAAGAEVMFLSMRPR
jgi:molybdopterin molybdotransferase